MDARDTIAEALAAGSGARTVAVGPGDYDEVVVLDMEPGIEHPGRATANDAYLVWRLTSETLKRKFTLVAGRFLQTPVLCQDSWPK